MRIGELARRSGVSLDTVRFYERRGLLPAPPRDGSGYRDYGVPSVERVRFIKELQELGFSLAESGSLLSRVDGGGVTCASERPRFEAVLAHIDRRLSELRRTRRKLAQTLAHCAANECKLVDRASSTRVSRVRKRDVPAR